MKPFGAAVVFLAVINLLTVSTSSSNVTDATSSQMPGLQNSSPTLTSTPLISNSPTGPDNYQSNPTIVSIVPTEDSSSTNTSRSTPNNNVYSPTEEIPRVNTTDSLNTDVNGSTVASHKMSSTTPKEGSDNGKLVPSVAAETTTLSTQVPDKGASTGSSAEPHTKPAIDDNESNKKDKNNANSGAEKLTTSNKGVKIAAGCVAAVIAVIVLVVIYKICQKKPPAAENAEVKASTETKENVKLLSVKTETPNSDTKRTSSNQMESIEC